MEEAHKDPEGTTEPSDLTENHEAKEGVSTPEEQPIAEVPEEFQVKEWEEDYKMVTPQKITDLQRDHTALVTNVLTAAEAKESMRRSKLEEDRRFRLERLENNVKSSKEKFEEILKGWETTNLKVVPQELQEAVNSQQQLCSAVIDEKKKLISDLKQVLSATWQTVKVTDDAHE